jgi:hypothetical protein
MHGAFNAKEHITAELIELGYVLIQERERGIPLLKFLQSGSKPA